MEGGRVKRPPRGHKDFIHDAVAEMFRSRGWSALDLSALGEGRPDLYVAKGAIGCLVEIKSKKSNAKAYQPTEKQERFAKLWRGWAKTVAGLGEAEILLDFLERIWKRTAAPVFEVEGQK
jgi:hypothetical protein